MDETNVKTRHGRSILTAAQVDQLTETIRNVQINTEGLTKKEVMEKAFEKTFGAREQWPIYASSSTISRYWTKAFPSGGKPSIKKTSKRHYKARAVAVIPTTPPTQIQNESKKIIVICPHCETLIKIQTTKL